MKGTCSQKTELFSETPDRKLANGRDFRYRKYKVEMVITISKCNRAMLHLALINEAVWFHRGKAQCILNLITTQVE
jgi:hypothetical protein